MIAALRGDQPNLGLTWLERLTARARGHAFQPRSGRFYFLRHGQTEHNRVRICQGQHDVPLNEVGHRQAAAAAALLAAVRPVAIHASDLLRVRQTAKPLAEQLEIEPITDVRLRERGFGVLENRPVHGQIWASTDPSVEPIERFVDRVLEGLAAALCVDDVLVVTHGGVRHVLAHALGLALADWTAHNALPLRFERQADDSWRVEALTAAGPWPAHGPMPAELDR